MPDKGLFDIHCHIVPSVDDGASSAEEAYKMLQMEYKQGVRNIIATPHYRLQMFETPIETVEHQFLVLKQLARKVAPDLHVYLGCEFHSNMEMVEMLRNGEVHTMAGSRYVLTEFSGSTKASYIRERLYSLLSQAASAAASSKYVKPLLLSRNFTFSQNKSSSFCFYVVLLNYP